MRMVWGGWCNRCSVGRRANLLFAIDYLLFMEVRRWRARLCLSATQGRQRVLAKDFPKSAGKQTSGNDTGAFTDCTATKAERHEGLVVSE